MPESREIPVLLTEKGSEPVTYRGGKFLFPWVVGIAILHLFLAGTVLGCFLFWRSLTYRTFDAVPRTLVEAHANSLIFGWIGFLLVFLTYRGLYLAKGIHFHHAHYRSFVLVSIAGGTLAHLICHGLQDILWPTLLLQGSLASGFLQIGGWGLFLVDLWGYNERIPKENQSRFEKCILLGGIWFWAGLVLEILTRLLHAANYGLYSIPPHLQYAIRHLQLSGGVLLMLIGLLQPLYRKHPPVSGWWQPLINRPTLWLLLLGVFLFNVSSPMVMTEDGSDARKGLVPRLGVLLAAFLETAGLISYFVSLRRIRNSARKRGIDTASPLKSWRGYAYFWLIVSQILFIFIAIHATLTGRQPPKSWTVMQIHVFSLGFILPCVWGLLARYSHDQSGEVDSLAKTPMGLVFAGIGIGFFPLFFLEAEPNRINHLLPLFGAGLSAVGAFWLGFSEWFRKIKTSSGEPF